MQRVSIFMNEARIMSEKRFTSYQTAVPCRS
ncbi:hypothetical protein DK59_1301 [Brucella abortus bv. 4 str. 292]|nr:hypothetical protein DK66_1388 [Brucella suis 1330]KFJ63528.1 hypothetical protein DK59_1301 [Brucella abortus bv. 4 str. 292]